MTAMGQEERFPPPRLNAGCGFRKETIAGSAAKGETRRAQSFVTRGLVMHWPSVLARANPLRKG
jgi:hypothetical protein